MPDDRPGYRADCAADNRALHRVAGHRGAYRCAAQPADSSTLFGARTCCERDEQAQNEKCLFHWVSP
jgi:hypothetical protein